MLAIKDVKLFLMMGFICICWLPSSLNADDDLVVLGVGGYSCEYYLETHTIGDNELAYRSWFYGYLTTLGSAMQGSQPFLKELPVKDIYSEVEGKCKDRPESILFNVFSDVLYPYIRNWLEINGRE